jgi:3-hydroxyisobutyrate dehydrogenase/glyoxylate/succinic semialdehyde reductase
MAAAAAARGLGFMDAPVAGSKDAAADGGLTFIAGGSEADVEEYRAELEAMGSRIIHAGETGMGSSLKVVINHQLAINMAAFSEGIVLGQELGIERDLLFNVMLNGPVTAPFLKNKQPKIESGDFEVEFPLQWMQKDLQMAGIAGFESGAALPLGSAAKELYKLAMRAGYGEQDFSAIYQFLYEEWDVE